MYDDATGFSSTLSSELAQQLLAAISGELFFLRRHLAPQNLQVR
jgi:hypothetical protein